MMGDSVACLMEISEKCIEMRDVSSLAKAQK